ncbi:zinc dependent phospholipase C family protein [Clostridium sp.]|uniref:zinc dependent phospholipase C family protein n=1 Tax=Clostridium sp. TaxID=1506 RepID=UPI0028501727|nr:zinc dependent phospholipase C family protein [Clostridium sp.]MDR3596539.1 zinc dependent phospholipase C family protein [Clostridium sp.]
MMNTHKIMAENILKHANTKSVYLINNKRFIWGNVKPDCAPKYKFKKHYFDESIDMIVDKIINLSSLTLEDIYFDMTIGKFSEELGVICHFLCDFFCAPHYYRWEFKSTGAVKKHMIYENKLAKLAKKFKPLGIINTNIKTSDVKDFIMELQIQYDGIVDYHNDLTFSYYVCDSILNFILNNVFLNDNKVNKAI